VLARAAGTRVARFAGQAPDLHAREVVMASTTDEPAEPRPHLDVSRRTLLIGGGLSVAVGAFVGCRSAVSAPSAAPRAVIATGPATSIAPAVAPVHVTMLGGGAKPVYVPDPGSTDPAAHALAENLFWTDALMEHARFFAMLMPGDELAAERRRAQDFAEGFASQFGRIESAGVDRGNVVAVSRTTTELTKPFIEFTRSMEDAQASGRLRSLVWPLYFDHTAREAERVVQRLAALSRGAIELDRNEVGQFWTRDVSDHSAFLAHLLDPQEFQTIDRAIRTARQFRDLHERRVAPTGRPDDPLVALVQEVVDFDAAIEQGIDTGRLRSVIHPALADHVRREAVKFLDEARRAV
jgi:Domain of unknown function (DUF2935)